MAWEKLSTASAVSVGKGKKHTSFSPTEATRDELLAQAIGRSGSLRAPTLKIGERYIVGYNEDMYREFLT